MLEWSGIVEGLFSSLESRTLRASAVRALNRQRIMEIKTERLANGSMMTIDCLGQMGHANETASAAAEGESICIYKKCRQKVCLTNLHVCMH